MVVYPPFGGSADRRSVLDRAHRGDIVGAFGRVPSFDTGPRLSARRRLATLLAVAGPGIVVLVADNDAGSFSVYAQAGQNYGLGLLWLFLLVAPVLYVLQEMVARLGAVTGAGHARLIFERFGHRWGAFALGDLLALNLLTLVTEFIGVDFALRYFGVSRYISVPLAACALLLFTVTGKFRRWEQAMYLLVAMNLIAIPLAFLGRPHPATLARGAVPGLHGEFSPGGVLFMMAIVGAAVSPWQLFFQQSSVVDKRITARWLNYERADTAVGTLLFTAVGAAMVVTCAFAFSGSAFHGSFVDLGSAAHALGSRLGHSAGALFALVLLNGSVLCAAVVTLTTSYALGDVLGLKHSLHRRWRDAPAFYGSFAVLVLLAATIELAPGVPLGAVTTIVQALAAVLLPGAAVFLLLLCNDKAVLGPWVNPRWLNALATLIVGTLLVLSGLLMTVLLFPHVDVRLVALLLGAGTAAGIIAAGALIARRGGLSSRFSGTPWERATWTMPALETIPAPVSSRARTVGLVALRLYLIVAALLLVVKAALAIAAG
ncbi:MAG: divalent metal cation transporter [Actinobacteria bacterium]|nr:divalent metal cation transporter [Actinomycetota bacterium]